ncbi:MAG: ABC transporter permease [Actinomycetaceae bacterium]|nr:ABC transporter permease [Actinomycetaceae bacterium]
MIRAEILKLRRSSVWAFAVILPLLAVISGGVNYWMNREMLSNGWDSMTSQVTLFYGMLFYSIGVALLIASLWRPEHQTSSWNTALVTGRPRMAPIAAKMIVAMIPVAAIQVCLLALTFIFGKAIGLDGGLPASFIQGALFVIVVSIPLVLFQSLLSMVMKSFAAPVAISMGLCLIGFLALAGSASNGIADVVSWILPHALVTRSMFLGSTSIDNSGVLSIETGTPLLISVVLMSVLLLGVTAWVARRRTVTAH